MYHDIQLVLLLLIDNVRQLLLLVVIVRQLLLLFVIILWMLLQFFDVVFDYSWLLFIDDKRQFLSISRYLRIIKLYRYFLQVVIILLLYFFQNVW